MGNSTRRVAWVTDIHLVFLWDKDRLAFDPEFDEFADAVLASDPDLIVVSGDIAEGPELLWYLDQLSAKLAGRPIYFVLGNHDFYRSSIRAIRREVAAHCKGRQDLVYLTVANEPLPLTSRVAIVGHDGWADGRFGELEWSRAKISDYAHIEELVAADETGRRAALNALGDEAAAHLERQLSMAVKEFQEIVLLTHVPPWLEASRYRGQLSDYEYAPHFASKSVGEAIVGVMKEAPECRLTVLCGHTHHGAEHRPLPNVVCFAGESEYGAPTLQRVFEFG